MQKARCHPANAGLQPLVGARFQVLFHSPARGSSHLSLTVLVRYRSSAVFSLAGWSPQIRTGFHVPRPTQVPCSNQSPCPYRGVTVYAAAFQKLPVQILIVIAWSYNPVVSVNTAV